MLTIFTLKSQVSFKKLLTADPDSRSEPLSSIHRCCQ